MSDLIPIFIGYDYRERAATNILIDSLYQNSNYPLSIIPLVTNQLRKTGIYYRPKDPKQSTDFSFTRFLVPYLMGYKGWAIFMDCDMLSRGNIGDLWNLRDEKYSLMCVKHNHMPSEKKKFQGEIQSAYPRKNWSSMMLFNSEKCKALNVDYVNTASGLDLHRFNWLDNDDEIGEIPQKWNYLVDVQSEKDSKDAKLLHWTLGGPWFNQQRKSGGELAQEWFDMRKKVVELWD